MRLGAALPRPPRVSTKARTFGGPPSSPAYITALSSYTITKFTSAANGSANLSNVIPAAWTAVNGTGSYGQSFNITNAYSGAAADAANACLYGNGGGHTDSACNLWWKADFGGTSAPTGFSALAYSDPAIMVSNTDPQSDGKPNASHTYGSMVFDPVLRRAWRYAGGDWLGGAMPTKNWALNAADNSFTQGPSTTYTADNAACSIFDATSRKVLVLNHAGQGWFHRLDANTKSSDITWNGTTGSDGNPIAAYDTSRGRAIITAPSQLYLVTPNWSAESISQSTLAPTGATTALSLRGACPLYDDVADVFWIIAFGEGSTGISAIYSMDPTTWAITSHALTGDTTGLSPSGRNNGLFNKAVGMWRWRAIGLVTDIAAGMLVIKLPATT